MAEKKFEGINIIAVEGSTECLGTGNSGKTRIAWSNERGTNWRANVCPQFDNRIQSFGDPDFVEIILHGDHEARTFIESLEYMAKELREQYKANKETHQ